LVLTDAEQPSNFTTPTRCRFFAASNLRELDLSLNLLTTVPRGVALFAPHLEILDLSCNEISSATMDSSFSAMRSLRQLDLSRNRIHYLAADDFRPLAGIALDLLNLGECELISVDDTVFDPLIGNLTCLSLAGNPLSAAMLERLFTRLGEMASRSAASVVIKPSSPLSSYPERWRQDNIRINNSSVSSVENSTGAYSSSVRLVAVTAVAVDESTSHVIGTSSSQYQDVNVSKSSVSNLTLPTTTAVAATQDSQTSPTAFNNDQV